MHTDRQHLYKSRHGIWYYRWVLPSRLRSKHPALPCELKRSTRTADIRHARAIARRLHRNFVVQYSMDLGMDAPWPDLTGIREFKLKYDAVTGILTEVEADAHEAETVRSIAQQIQAANLQQAEMIAFINRRGRELRDEARLAPEPSDSTAPVATVKPEAPQSPTISKAFADLAEDQLSDSVWSKETYTYTHEPSNRLFRELVGEPVLQLQDGNPTDVQTTDLALASLTPTRMAEFIKEFRR